MSAQTPAKVGFGQRLLDGIERIGNKLPEPFTLFLGLFLITGAISTAMAIAGVSVAIPGSDEIVTIKGLFTGEGMAWLTTTMGENYIGFPPLATVLPILLAVGVAEKSGMLAAAVRVAFGSSPRWLLPYAVGFVGVVGSIMADSAFIIIPPLAALVFKAAGRHPMAGLIGGFAATGAGYSTSIVPTSLDALFAGITTSVMETLPGIEYQAVNPVSNYYFNIVASIMLAIIAGFIIDKLIEPNMVRKGVPRDYVDATTQGLDKKYQATDVDYSENSVSAEEIEAAQKEVSPTLEPAEKRGLLWALLSALALTAVILVSVLIPDSPWRNEEGGFLPKSPLLSSIVFIVFAYFMLMGVVYGIVVGTIRSMNDVVRMMAQSIIDMMSFLILAFILGQFIALFNWTGIGSWIAVAGASGLEAIGLTGFAAIIGFMLLASVLNLFIVSGSSMWTLMAAVFVPLFALLGYEPAFIQAAFRVGDSATQVITPLNPYMIVLLGLVRRYEPNAGLGTVISRMFPFVIPFWLAWAALLALWYFLDLPLGPGNGIFLNQS
ncbi:MULTISPECIES: AbgT family transporter [Brevibacterium]|uniref:AbgT family transporter n=3 Tax=Bacteria TaxID=2 RepID=A0A269ZD81_9MICO|nr:MULTISPECIES: AbgT family transporter [Brevibacterium]NJE65467.1 AbgT family transporter [Brevibacterium sp. LS14]SIG95546.1 Aminobenzoyl-glutamate transport protein [Mycobacteroides abscessus subsp. abscessus]MCM1014263.1 AbgT family transporter [Brevibacterium sp. XM4083]MCT1447651.1 AbgT family transporter [Brevibacterium casei]MCT1550693.1 AbgT family transporter [Brevibacterium casei]